MKVEEFYSPEEWNKLLGLTGKTTGLAAVTFTLDGKPVNKPEFFNEICPLFKSHPECAAECSNSQKRLSKEVLKKRKTIIGKCNAGMVKVVIPVKYNDELIGMTGGCGVYFTDEEPDIDSLMKVAQKCNLENEAKEKINSVRKISKSLLEQAIKSLERKIEFRAKQI